MNYGQGSIVFVSKNPAAAPPPPVPVQSMRNGLSLVGTAGELGANPLLHDTSFDLANFDFHIDNAGNKMFYLKPSTKYGLFTADGANNNSSFQVNGLTNYSNFGDVSGTLNGLNVAVDAGNNLFVVQNFVPPGTFNYSLYFDVTNRSYEIGDISGIGNSTELIITDSNRGLAFVSAGGVRSFDIDSVAHTYNLGDVNDISNGYKLHIDGGANSFYLGDFNFVSTGRYLNMDASGSFTVVSGGAVNLRLDPVSGTWLFGDGSGTGMQLDGENGTQDFSFKHANVPFLSCRPTGILTTDPGSGAGRWLFGKQAAAAVALDATQYIEVKIDGVLYKLGIVT